MADATTFDYDDSQLRARLAELERLVAGEGKQALRDAGEQILGDAQQITPIASGHLAGDGPTIVEDGESIVIGFNTPYAAAVHERQDIHHDQGQAKYLETSVKAHLPRVSERVAQRIAALK